MRSLLLATGMFSVIRVPRSTVDRRTAAAALRWLPAVGAALGAVAALAGLLLGGRSGSAPLAAVVTVAVLALLTRGLHLDGLADLADGLGSGRPAVEALEIMRRPDIGPFGVAAVIGALLLQSAALATAYAGLTRPQGVLVAALAAATGRYAALDAAATSAPAAHPSGFGALVAGSAGPWTRTGVGLGVLTAGGVLAVLSGLTGPGVAWLLIAACAGTLAARLVRWHAVRRLGGTTGDVFGALVEISTATTALLLAAGVGWEVLR
jgi:adenosylcobinamide-GDP ribazoletransferase